MNGNDLLRGFDFIEEHMIQEATVTRIKRTRILLLMPMAASLILLISVIWVTFEYKIIIPNEQLKKEAIIEDSFESAGNSQENTLYFNNMESTMTEDSLWIEGHFWEYLTDSQIEKLLPTLSEKAQIEGIVNYSRVNEVTSVFNVEATIRMQEQEINIIWAPNQISKCYVIEGEPQISEINGIKVEAGLFVTDPNSRGERNYIYYADFMIDDIAYSVEYVGSKEEEEFFTGIIVDIISGGKADLSILAETEHENDKE